MESRPVVPHPLNRLAVKLVYAQRAGAVGKLVRLLLRIRGTDIAPASLPADGSLMLGHAGTGVVVHPKVRLGSRVALFQHVTLGRADVDRALSPETRLVLEDDVIVGAGAVVLVKSGERLTVGRGAFIGANAVVTTDVPPGQVWAGNPAQRVS